VAIKLFQSTHQLTPDGVAGAKTMQALQTYLTPESSEPDAP
jgi:peptidoglycan hydrolase-like protein with peptidoglycan-binding domain